MPRMKKRYLDVVLPKMKEEKRANVHRVPKIDKVIINVGAGRSAVADAKSVEYIEASLAAITGQKPVTTKARKAIAGFKLRQGQPVGVMVTLRGPKMFEFLDRLISTALPRVRDFRGLKRNAFSKGSYSLGLSDHTVFPEIIFESGRAPFGLEVNIVTSAKSSEDALELLINMGFPFKRSVNE